MKTETFDFPTSSGVDIFTRKWLTEAGTPLKAVVQIAHGMAEHSGRYERFARTLCHQGIGVYANDHRGHGQTAGSLEAMGFFAQEHGWDLVVEDMERLTDIISSAHDETPIFLLGHSMGSFLSRAYVARSPEKIRGVILSGTGGDPGFLGKIGKAVATLETWFKGKKAPSPLLNSLSFGGFNKAFKPNRTDFDWLSRDEAEVDKYVADPYCGGIFSAGFFSDLIGGINEINKAQVIAQVPRDLPILFLSGNQDPVGDGGKGVRQVFHAFQRAGINDVRMKLYDGARHEILNETNREEVFEDIIQWIHEKI